MGHLLGIDTGGTYTDAAVLDGAATRVLGRAKALTSRPDLSTGVAAAIDAALAAADVTPAQIDMVSLSTTLATNALVEGQGGRVALVFIGFDAAELSRGGLDVALNGDPVIALAGGHDHAGSEAAPLDLESLSSQVAALEGVTGFAVAARFATRNPAHERAARDAIRAQTGLPVTCSFELSAALGGPKRALTAVLNARLIGMIASLIDAVEAHLALIGTGARLMVVRGDGALIPADLARRRPIETILSGPAASAAGAAWLTDTSHALVSDIGGTTTDICQLTDGRPRIDPQGALVGGFRTMVEAVAMRTWGLGGDSEVHLQDGLSGDLRLGPRRVMPIALLAVSQPTLVHAALDLALTAIGPPLDGGTFAVPLWSATPMGLDKREALVASRLSEGPRRTGDVVLSRMEAPALTRLVTRGLVMVAGVTPSDAAHVLGLTDQWDGTAAQKALTLFARRRRGDGSRCAADASALARRIIDQVTAQTADCLLQAAFADDPGAWGDTTPDALARHPLTRAGLARHNGLIATQLSLAVPVIGLGASAASYYGAVGDTLHTRVIVPEHADVANAIGAVVGQVSQHATGTVSAPGGGRFVAHLSGGPVSYGDPDTAMDTLIADLTATVTARAADAGVSDPQVAVARDINRAEVEGSDTFYGATIRVTARGRPRIARDSA
ncbi:N-methylhydantoinase A/oxoprolinase/acetone carboxylase, beta subunit [Loktanella sp. DSM 29012]|uniref:hydantoinase/oxoprolinase N-terminal domain-containing protein n=1 Tax=Loktanella sp. DSM 29012 TaxID=1881056 RepID=UPI0008D21C9E|nr:hydantoinase/oxoprolinase family protein [Loktanella sp. DSM 29012]SEP55758.1 N-methylhydantoinase A/oxoprolinase/acetone carboxylase, beta subunit [Loktanella sp. DSM 29012]